MTKRKKKKRRTFDMDQPAIRLGNDLLLNYHSFATHAIECLNGEEFTDYIKNMVHMAHGDGLANSNIDWLIEELEKIKGTYYNE